MLILSKKFNIMTPTQGVTIGVNPTNLRDPGFTSKWFSKNVENVAKKCLKHFCWPKMSFLPQNLPLNMKFWKITLYMAAARWLSQNLTISNCHLSDSSLNSNFGRILLKQRWYCRVFDSARFDEKCLVKRLLSLEVGEANQVVVDRRSFRLWVVAPSRLP